MVLSSSPRVTGIICIFVSVWWLWLVAHWNQTSSIPTYYKTSQEQWEVGWKNMIQIKYSRFVLRLIDVKHVSCFFIFKFQLLWCVVSYKQRLPPHTDTLVGIRPLCTVHWAVQPLYAFFHAFPSLHHNWKQFSTRSHPLWALCECGSDVQFFTSRAIFADLMVKVGVSGRYRYWGRLIFALEGVKVRELQHQRQKKKNSWLQAWFLRTVLLPVSATSGGTVFNGEKKSKFSQSLQLTSRM